MMRVESEDDSVASPGPTAKPTLERSLRNRHIQFIALGGAIGSGLFLGSGNTIGLAGPSILLGYVIGGGLVFIVMRALGEMAAAEPVSGSFSAYAHRYVGSFAGFAVGWTYWFSWTIVNITELTAFAVYMQYWFPSLPRWLSVLVAIVVILAINLISARSFAEAEFWVTLIKVAAIVGLIALGFIILLFGIGQNASVSNLWNDGGVFPHGIFGLLLAFPLIIFSFGGTELVGIAAGEARDPQKSIPRAVNGVIVRIVLFYVGGLLFILMLVPWSSARLEISPFVAAFHDVGIPNAPHVLNFVVITAVLSAFNSGMYSSGRMLLTLAQNGQAPRVFTAISKRGHVPYVGLFFSAAVLLIAVVLNAYYPPGVFLSLASIASFAVIFTWAMILITHWRFRRAKWRDGSVGSLTFRLFAWPLTTYIGLGGLALVLVLMAFHPSTSVALVIAPLWFGALGIGYVIMRRRESIVGRAVDAEGDTNE